MNQDPPVFDAELLQVIAQTQATGKLIDHAGRLLATQQQMARRLKQQMELTSDAFFDCVDAWTNFPRMPLTPTRREQLEEGLNTALGKSLPSFISRPGDASQEQRQTPPPIPKRYQQDSRSQAGG